MKIKSSSRHSSTPAPTADAVIIVRGSDDWDEWMEYFIHTGNPHGHQHSYARKVGRMTVPAKFPEMFDPAWRSREPVSVMQGEHPPRPKYSPSSGMPSDIWEATRQREAIDRMLQTLRFESSTFARARDKRDAELEKRKAQEWVADYQVGEPQAVKVGARLAEKIEAMSKRHIQAAE